MAPNPSIPVLYKRVKFLTNIGEHAEANALFNDLQNHFHCDYDVSGSIGKRYRRQDEIGTPFCITVDFDTLEDNEDVQNIYSNAEFTN